MDYIILFFAFFFIAVETMKTAMPYFFWEKYKLNNILVNIYEVFFSLFILFLFFTKYWIISFLIAFMVFMFSTKIYPRLADGDPLTKATLKYWELNNITTIILLILIIII